VGIRRVDHATPLYPQKLALNFVDKWRSLSLYSSLGGQRPRSLFVCLFVIGPWKGEHCGDKAQNFHCIVVLVFGTSVAIVSTCIYVPQQYREKQNAQNISEFSIMFKGNGRLHALAKGSHMLQTFADGKCCT
jgi:hypothetical protein